MSTILLAEDSPTHTLLIRRLLEEAGHQVVCVEDGQKALDQLNGSGSVPDLVITDLRMPDVNGVELVSQIAERWVALPSIVVTARGSESFAVDALAKGAANFVPKDSLSRLLVRSVRQTIQLARIDASVEESSRHEFPYEFTVTLHSDPCMIEPVAWSVVQAAKIAGRLDPTTRVRLGMAVMSGLFNAVCFGNLEFADDDELLNHVLAEEPSSPQTFAEKTKGRSTTNLEVTVKVSIGEHDTRVGIRHAGRGPTARLTPAPGTPESFEVEQCRQLMLITSFMDDVVFRHDSTEMIMVKKHH